MPAVPHRAGAVLITCQCDLGDPSYACEEPATQEDLLCDECRGGCTGAIRFRLGAEERTWHVKGLSLDLVPGSLTTADDGE
jgi:hypothetical protein